LPLTDGVISLRRITLADAPAIAEACADPEIPRWTFMPEGLTVPQARDWIERDVATNQFAGQVGIGHLDWEQQVGEIFYWLAAGARGRSFANRATKLVAQWAFVVLNVARIEITVDPANLASQRVAVAAGFTREGVLRSYQRFKDGRMDAVMYSRLADDD
jgi:RimJ/RimL family protein N-acetyltransferase